MRRAIQQPASAASRSSHQRIAAVPSVLSLSIISVFLIFTARRTKDFLSALSAFAPHPFVLRSSSFSPDQHSSSAAFFWLISSEYCSCPITLVFVRSQTLSGTFFLLLYQPLSISENPFDQCYRWLGFDFCLPGGRQRMRAFISARAGRRDLLLASKVHAYP